MECHGLSIVLRIYIRIYQLHCCITYFITKLTQNTAVSACRASTTPPARKAKTTDCTQSLNRKAVLHKVVQYSEESCEAACVKLKFPVDQDISELSQNISGLPWKSMDSLLFYHLSTFLCSRNSDRIAWRLRPPHMTRRGCISFIARDPCLATWTLRNRNHLSSEVHRSMHVKKPYPYCPYHPYGP